MRLMKVHVLDVGHGDTIILEMPVGQRDKIFSVVDCIKWESKTRDYLDKLGVEKLEFVCGTHPHEDHVVGIKKLLEAYEGNVGEYWDSGKEHARARLYVKYQFRHACMCLVCGCSKQ